MPPRFGAPDDESNLPRIVLTLLVLGLVFFVGKAALYLYNASQPVYEPPDPFVPPPVR